MTGPRVYCRGDFKTQPLHGWLAVPSGSGQLSLFRTIQTDWTGRNCWSTPGWVLKSPSTNKRLYRTVQNTKNLNQLSKLNWCSIPIYKVLHINDMSILSIPTTNYIQVKNRSPWFLMFRRKPLQKWFYSNLHHNVIIWHWKYIFDGKKMKTQNPKHANICTCTANPPGVKGQSMHS